ncbi:response regulator transcription factor [Lysobacter soli]|uniref:response regulator transcription factor n=1 Tax=Lysobacter soli TaxID=453783 RepID=UPI0037C946B0
MLLVDEPLLLADTDPADGSALATHLGARGFAVDVLSPLEALAQVSHRPRHSAYVLSDTLPTVDGTSMCRHLRTVIAVSAPIMVISAADTLEAKLMAFADGADDVLTRPVSAAELGMRVSARILRWRRLPGRSVLRVADLTLDRDSHVVERGGVALRLTPIGFRMLEMVMRAFPRPVPRDELIKEVWPARAPKPDALRMQIYLLRKQVNRAGVPLLGTLGASGLLIAAPAPKS